MIESSSSEKYLTPSENKSDSFCSKSDGNTNLAIVKEDPLNTFTTYEVSEFLVPSKIDELEEVVYKKRRLSLLKYSLPYLWAITTPEEIDLDTELSKINYISMVGTNPEASSTKNSDPPKSKKKIIKRRIKKNSAKEIKKKTVKEVSKVMCLHSEGLTVKEISEKLIWPLKKVRRLYKLGTIYNDPDGLVEMDIPEVGAKSKFEKVHVDWIIKKIQASEISMTLDELKKAFDEEFEKDGITISRSTIQRILEDNNFSYKKVPPRPPKHKNNPKRIKKLNADRGYAAYQILQAHFDPTVKVVTIDETTFMNKDFGIRGWMTPGDDVREPELENLEKRTAIVGSDETSVVGFVLVKGSTSWKEMAIFYNGLIKNLKMSPKQDKIVIILDNASWHSSSKLPNTLDGNIKFLYNAQYTPQLNPIETLFSFVKSSFRYNNFKLKGERMEESIIKGFKEISETQVQGSIKNTMGFIELALKGEELPLRRSELEESIKRKDGRDKIFKLS